MLTPLSVRNTNLPRNQFKEQARIPSFAWLLTSIPLLMWLMVSIGTTNDQLFLLINSGARSLPDLVWVFFDLFGNGWYVFALISGLLLFAPRMLIAALIAGSIAGLTGRLLKISLQMPRPAAVLDHSSFYILGKPLSSLSMPSGHTLTAFALATALYFSVSPEKRKPLLFLFLLATGTGFARIAVGAHWPADVMAGASVGIAGGLAGTYLASQIPERLLSPRAWLMRLLSIGAMVCIYMLITKQIDFTESYPFQVAAAVIGALSLVAFANQTLRRSRYF